MIYAQLMGGLGNQLFIYSFCKRLSIETENNVTFYFDSEDGRSLEISKFDIDKRFQISREMFRAEALPNASAYKIFRKIIEHLPVGKLQKIFICLACRFGVVFIPEGYVAIDYKGLKKSKDIIVVGFFQSPQYVDPIKQLICNEIKVTKDIDGCLSSESQRVLEEICQRNSVCIHIRRGDYLKPQYRERFLVCTDEYYKTAIEQINSKVAEPVYYIFSDSIELVKDTMPFLNEQNVRYVNNGGELAVVADYIMMKECKHFIMSNSTLSWWAQYLAKNPKKLVIAPDKWLKTGYDNREIYQDDWILVKV